MRFDGFFFFRILVFVVATIPSRHWADNKDSSCYEIRKKETKTKKKVPARRTKLPKCTSLIKEIHLLLLSRSIEFMQEKSTHAHIYNVQWRHRKEEEKAKKKKKKYWRKWNENEANSFDLRTSARTHLLKTIRRVIFSLSLSFVIHSRWSEFVRVVFVSRTLNFRHTLEPNLSVS